MIWWFLIQVILLEHKIMRCIIWYSTNFSKKIKNKNNDDDDDDDDDDDNCFSSNKFKILS